MQINKTIVISYALIGAAVVGSTLYTKKLELDIKRHTKKMQKDQEDLKASITNLGK